MMRSVYIGPSFLVLSLSSPLFSSPLSSQLVLAIYLDKSLGWSATKSIQPARSPESAVRRICVTIAAIWRMKDQLALWMVRSSVTPTSVMATSPSLSIPPRHRARVILLWFFDLLALPSSFSYWTSLLFSLNHHKFNNIEINQHQIFFKQIHKVTICLSYWSWWNSIFFSWFLRPCELVHI